MNKTEARILETVERKGYFVGTGKREFMVAARMRDQGKLAHFDVKFDSWNAGSHGRYIVGREVYITKRPASGGLLSATRCANNEGEHQ